MLLCIVRDIGVRTLSFVRTVGAMVIFLCNALSGILELRMFLPNFITQIYYVGFGSLPVVGMTAIFSGAVLALQSYTGFSRFSAEGSIATVVVLSITRELGPVLAGLMVAGRVGASIAAEIGTMRVTEQIDALHTLATDPVKYLVTPRLFACLISLPCLVFIADIIGVMGGYVVSIYKLHFNSANYLTSTFKYLEFMDVVSGIIKAAVFGLIIGLVSCYSGFYCERGARGVGKATTTAVVMSSVLILLSNYITTEVLFAN